MGQSDSPEGARHERVRIHAENRPQRRPNRLIITGALFGALALALLAGGGALVWAHEAKQDGGGYYASGSKHLTTSTYALVSEGLDVGTSGPDALFRSGRLGTIRVSATGMRARPVFVGIARTSQVAAYLGSVSHDAITDFEVDPLSVIYARRAGRATPSAPGRQTFWTAKASGSGRQTMTWPVAKGDWAVVVMNADGARGVHTSVSVAARVPLLLELGVGLLVAAGLAAAGAVAAIAVGRPAPREVDAGRVRSILPLRRPEWSRMATPYAAPLVVADARQPPRLSVLRAVAAAGLATAGCALGLALANDDVSDLQIALLEWISIPYIAAGLVAWWRRPDSRLGVLMIAGGFASALSALAFAGYALPHTIGLVFDILPAVIFLHVYLAFPDGRLRSPFERWLVGAAYASAIGLQLLKMALGGVGPNNVLEVSIRPDAAQTVESIQLVSISAICVVGIGVLARRRRRAGRPRRRPVALLIDSFAVGLLMIAVLFVSGAFGGPAFVTIQRLTLLVIGILPIVFLIALLDARLARSSVGDLFVELRADPSPTGLRDALARALRDPSLTLAYWLPEFETWADLDGRPVQLPGPQSGRSTTFVDRDGGHVAALLHDPGLEDEPELLAAVRAAAAIALENGRLQAEQKANLEELKGSRARVIEAGQKERQRLERNLHDGAQQRLVALSLELSMLKRQLADDAAASVQIERARGEIAASLEELRAVARGLHPAVLSGHGLEVALQSLVAHAPAPVQLSVTLDDRLPEQVEVAAYYVVSESLANIGKHAQATSVSVAVSRAAGLVVIEVTDDGVGGADTERGSGLRGLADRVEAHGGRLRVWSPLGTGTRVRAEMPCE